MPGAQSRAEGRSMMYDVARRFTGLLFGASASGRYDRVCAELNAQCVSHGRLFRVTAI